MPNRNGITLMEILVVLVVLALVAIVLVPLRLWSSSEGYFDVLKDDIKNLASAEEIYYSEHYTYTNNFQDLDFVPSEGVTLSLSKASDRGWLVIAKHGELEPTSGCGLYYGDVDTSLMEILPSAPGEIVCVER